MDTGALENAAGLARPRRRSGHATRTGFPLLEWYYAGAGRLRLADQGMVLPALQRRHRAAKIRLARHSIGPRRTDLRAYRLWQNAGGLFERAQRTDSPGTSARAPTLHPYRLCLPAG